MPEPLSTLIWTFHNAAGRIIDNGERIARLQREVDAFAGTEVAHADRLRQSIIEYQADSDECRPKLSACAAKIQTYQLKVDHVLVNLHRIPAAEWMESVREASQALSEKLNRESLPSVQAMAEQAETIDAERGIKVKAGGKLGPEIRHGKEDERQQEYDEWQAHIDKLMQDEPELSITKARRKTATHFGERYDRVLEHTSDPRKKLK